MQRRLKRMRLRKPLRKNHRLPKRRLKPLQRRKRLTLSSRKWWTISPVLNQLWRRPKSQLSPKRRQPSLLQNQLKRQFRNRLQPTMSEALLKIHLKSKRKSWTRVNPKKRLKRKKRKRSQLQNLLRRNKRRKLPKRMIVKMMMLLKPLLRWQ